MSKRHYQEGETGKYHFVATWQKLGLTNTSNTWGSVHGLRMQRTLECLLSFQTVIQAHFPCRAAGREDHQHTNSHQSQLAKLTSPATNGVSASRIRFSLGGWACLACGFSCLFSPRGTVSVPGCGCSATHSFGRGGQSGTLLFFSLSISRFHLGSSGKRFSIRPL